MEENKTTNENRTLGHVLEKFNPNIAMYYHFPLLLLGFLGLLFGIQNIFKLGISQKETITLIFNGAIYAALGALPLYYKKDNYKLVDAIASLGVSAIYIWAFASGISTNGYFIGLLFAPAFVIHGVCVLVLYLREKKQ